MFVLLEKKNKIRYYFDAPPLCVINDGQVLAILTIIFLHVNYSTMLL